MKSELAGDRLRVRFDRTESQRVAACWDDMLLELLCVTSGCAPGEARRIEYLLGDELDPRWVEVWVTPSGGRLEYVGEAVMSAHGCHGQTMKARVTGLPAGVALSAGWHVDHRSGGTLTLELAGGPGLAEIEARLRTSVA